MFASFQSLDCILLSVFCNQTLELVSTCSVTAWPSNAYYVFSFSPFARSKCAAVSETETRLLTPIHIIPCDYTAKPSPSSTFSPACHHAGEAGSGV